MNMTNAQTLHNASAEVKGHLSKIARWHNNKKYPETKLNQNLTRVTL